MTANYAYRAEERALRTAVVKRPALAQPHAALASFLCKTGRVDEALGHVDCLIDSHPSKLWPMAIKAGILSSERRAEDALAVHRMLVAMAPDIPPLWANFGNDLAAVGKVDEAEIAFRKTIERAPDFGAAWLGLTNLPRAPLYDADIAAMEKGLALVRDPYQKIQLLFALGRVYGALGAFGKSFEKFAEANALRETVVPYDDAGLAAFVDAHQTLSASFFAPAQDISTQTERAIFIIGMPRSGSTLVEQILASHPDVEGMGELFALPDIATSISAFDAPDDFIHRLKTLTDAEAMQLGARYLEGARRYRRTNRRHFTDKMPANWRLIALIHRILPGARIIDVRRAPVPCCFSAYATYFNRHTDFPNTLEDLGRYYRHYRRMIEMLRGVVPDRLYHLNHAQLVLNAEQEVRALLGFLRLPFSPLCLRPQDNRRAIYTPSAQQVRTPIRHENDRSNYYLPWLNPLQAMLDAG